MAQNFFIGHGDVAQLDFIVKTLEEKLYIIPGITCEDEINIPSAELINYWVGGELNVDDNGSRPGAKQSFGEQGLYRKTVAIDRSAKMNGVIPGVNLATCSANILNNYVIKSTIEAANKINRHFLTKLEGIANKKFIGTLDEESGEMENTESAVAPTTTYDADDIYRTVLDLRAEFIKQNEQTYLEPTALFVSPEAMARLKEKNLVLYKDNSPYGTFLEMEIIEAPNLTKNLVMMNKKAMISGVAFNAVRSFDGSYLGYADGVAYIGEIAYTNTPTEYGADYAVVPVLAL
jgi:hypothetical protein